MNLYSLWNFLLVGKRAASNANVKGKRLNNEKDDFLVEDLLNPIKNKAVLVCLSACLSCNYLSSDECKGQTNSIYIRGAPTI